MTPLDPFDLPEWLGEGEVIWTSDDVTRTGWLIAGWLTGAGDPRLACDLLAVDCAYPAPVVEEAVRTSAHQAWTHGQVLLVSREDRPTLAVPGVSFTADEVLDALTRLAKAVGAAPERFSVHLRLG